MLELEYDGGAYFGFQTQPDKPTIQVEVETALFRLTGEGIRVVAAGRTDAGVHAKGQVVSFRTESRYPVRQFLGALNYYLPDDIAVKAVAEVPPGFDARRSAIGRRYRYFIFNRRSPSPFWRRFAYHFPAKLEIDPMRAAAAVLVGEHDFAAFAGRGEDSPSTVRRVFEASLEREGDLIVFDIAANAFLTHQVRNMAGTLIWVGTGKIDLAAFVRITEGKDRRAAGPAVPSHGLFFMKVDYPAECLRV